MFGKIYSFFKQFFVGNLNVFAFVVRDFGQVVNEVDCFEIIDFFWWRRNFGVNFFSAIIRFLRSKRKAHSRIRLE